MVDANMFKDAFGVPATIKPKEVKAKVVYNEDPEIAKLRLLVLKALTIIVAGGAILLVVWRILLKFF